MTDASAATTTVTVNNGTLNGSIEDNVHIFRGVPFAAPPTGALRWREPQPCPDWEGERDATQFSASALQKGTDINTFMETVLAGVGHGFVKRNVLKLAMKFAPKVEQSEDCLYLNVRSPDITGRLPVMVWIHGGDHQDGSGSEPFYDSNTLPHAGVVLVTINYRLGLMGYLCHPELTNESAVDVSGNYGTLDQIAALKWVRDNIAHFGGDPKNVTIFGESAGGESVAHMLTSPLARGLFHRAIMQSAANSGQLTHLNKTALEHTSAEQQGLAFANKVVGEAYGQIELLRNMPAENLMALVRQEQGDLGGYFPAIDGYVLPYSPFECFKRGQQAKVPLMVGSNSDEATVIFPMMQTPLISHRFNEAAKTDTAALIRSEYGDDADRLFALYPGLENGDIDAQTQFLTDEMFGAKAYFYATCHAASGENTYFYLFNQTSPLKGQTAGAFHAAEIAYVFGSEVPIFPIDENGRALSAQMSQYWRNFARAGDPSDNNLPTWDNTNADDNHQWMSLGKEVGMTDASRMESYAIMNRRLDRILANLTES